MLPIKSNGPEKENMKYQKQSTGSLVGFQMTKLFGGYHNLVSGELETWMNLDQLKED